MSDNRKVLMAKRKTERSKVTNPAWSSKNSQDEANSRRGTKRPGCSGGKNLANDRLKKLRTSLNQEVANSKNPSVVANPKVNKVVRNVQSARKRPQSAAQVVSTKVPRREPQSNKEYKDAFVFKEEFISQRNTFATVTPNPFAVSSLVQAPVCDDAGEDMEWTPYEAETAVTTVYATTSASNSGTLNASACNKFSDTSHSFVIVVDTNIFISELQVIKSIVTMNITGPRKPLILIPWIVLEELDFIKDDNKKSNIRSKAQDAIKYIHNTFDSKNERMKGQTLEEVNDQRDLGKSPDNKIIACCLQVLEKRKEMILLTSDINLKNKAHFNNIPVCSHTEIMPKILLALKHSKAQIILDKMTTLCSTVIRECAKEAYGPTYNKMPIGQTSPKTLQECISLFTKYWFPVFQEFLMKQFKKSIDDLSTFLAENNTVNDGTTEMSELLRLCVRVCLFLKDVKCCKNIIESTIRDLNNIKES